jgi:hypothetical protein
MNINSELMQNKSLMNEPSPRRALINHMEVSTQVRHCNGQPLGVNIVETERMMLEAFDQVLCRTSGFCEIGYPRLQHVEAVRSTQQTPARWFHLHYLIADKLLEFRGFIGPSTVIDLEKRVVCVPDAA